MKKGKHLFNQLYLLNTYHIPGIMLDIKDMDTNQVSNQDTNRLGLRRQILLFY